MSIIVNDPLCCLLIVNILCYIKCNKRGACLVLVGSYWMVDNYNVLLRMEEIDRYVHVNI